MTEAGKTAGYAERHSTYLARLQDWLHGTPTPSNHWIPQYRGTVAVYLGNLVSEARYWGGRLRGGR